VLLNRECTTLFLLCGHEQSKSAHLGKIGWGNPSIQLSCPSKEAFVCLRLPPTRSLSTREILP
jgi:hypothetical protein